MKKTTQFHIRPARPEEAGLFYTPHPEEDKRLGTVGHVRMDFGRSGNEFWHTWWPRGPEELNSPAFKAELQQIVGKLREDVLKSRFAMERFCYNHGGKIDGGYVQNYGCDLIREDNAVLSPYSKSSEKEKSNMKFSLNHNTANKTLSIPRAALQLSGLAGVSDLILHTDSGCILLLPGDPTVAELLKTISLISAVTPQLISRLAERSQMAMEAGMTETACGACEHEPHCSGLEIPPCQLAEAGISPNAALESFVEKGRVIVQAAEKTAADVLIDELDDDVRTMLEDSGVQMEGVCRLLEKEEVSG